ncbi:MAG TPA: galactokinase [Jiangellales bacterium]|nr:galactokinase [Jiangellales bacterium]
MRPAAAVAGAFTDATGGPPEGVWAAPGRVNLIGEHTDYTGGFVLPLALPLGVVCAGAGRDDGLLSVRSAQVPEEVHTVDVRAVAPGEVGGWAAYAVGVAWALRERWGVVQGASLLVDGDVPPGAGLSSSAALECVVATVLGDLSGAPLTADDLARLARQAENDFVGAPTGVMDQLAAMHGRAGHVLFIDTRSGGIEPVPFDPGSSGTRLLVVDTRAPHKLVDGEYAQRRRECEEAARALGVVELRDASPADLDGGAGRGLPSVLRRRARHVVTENARVLEVVSALRGGGDPGAIGPLLTASHVSLRDDFEVTVPQLDVAVEATLAAGAYGARMTGGGFGGCIIALVDAAARPAVVAAVEEAFAGHGFGRPTSFVAVPSDGARRLT